MKAQVWLVLVSVFLVSASCTKPSAVAGRYLSDRDRTPRDSLDLEAGGGFTLQEDGATFTGTYEVKGDSIALKLPGGSTVVSKIEGPVLVDEAGGRWTKQ